MADETKLMRVGELAETTGVSVQTIHYYLREGLLPPPLKTAHNMAYYGPEYVEDIRLIKELQGRRYLPLSVIKMVLEHKREGKDVGHLEDMRLSLEAIFRPLGPEEELEPVSLAELIAMAGLPAAKLEQLEQIGILMPTATPEGKRYDGLDVRVARMAKKLLDLGLEPSDLSFYAQYVDALRIEASVIRDGLFRAEARGVLVSGKEIKEVLDNLKESLATKVYRQAALHFHQEGGESFED